MGWKVIVNDTANKQLKRIPRWDVERLIAAINEFASNPFAGDIEKMEGEKTVWRRRMGAYRIIYEIRKEKRIVYVSDVRRRTSKTY